LGRKWEDWAQEGAQEAGRVILLDWACFLLWSDGQGRNLHHRIGPKVYIRMVPCMLVQQRWMYVTNSSTSTAILGDDARKLSQFA
jgi:hypothetical protein